MFEPRWTTGKAVRYKQATLLIALAGAIGATIYQVLAPPPYAPAKPAPAAPITNLTAEAGRYLFSVTLHTPEEITGLLARAEELAKTTRAGSRDTGIALVLHGPEIEIFARKNYSRFQKTVDQAARLDTARVIELKMCRTEMKHRGIGEQDIPGFIELVPYGPDEARRLQRKGYVYL